MEEKVNRKATLKLYPNKNQEKKLWEILKGHQVLYNALLEQRIDAYQRCGVSLNYYDQANELPELKKQFSEYKKMNAQSLQNTCKKMESQPSKEEMILNRVN